VGATGEGTGESFLGEVLDHLSEGLVVTRADGAIVLVNRTFAEMTGLDADEVVGEDVGDLLGPAVATGPEGMGDVLARPDPGRPLALARGAAEPLVVMGSGQRMTSRFVDDCFVTLLRPAGPAQEEGPVQELLDNLDIGVICCDASGAVVLVNRAARELQGLPADLPLVGRPFPAPTDLRMPRGEPVERDDHPLLRALLTGVADTAHVVLGDDDRGTQVAISARPVLVGGRRGAIAVLRDVTAEWQDQVDLAHHAFHDPLTGVANRYLLIETLVRMLHGLGRQGGAVLLVFLDLDNFKQINDEHGHDVGDQVLTAVARRLQGTVRSDDIVARLGGDEFVVAHVSQDEAPDGDVVVARIREALSAPYQFGGLIVDVGVSAGWATTSSSEATPEYLLSRADDRMYVNKRQRAATSPHPPS